MNTQSVITGTHGEQDRAGGGGEGVTDLIALWIGRCVMGVAGFAVVAFLAWIALQIVWAAVIKPSIAAADLLMWKRAKANGSWREPRVVDPAK